MLRKLLLGAGTRPPVPIENKRARGSGALIEREDEMRHGSKMAWRERRAKP